MFNQFMLLKRADLRPVEISKENTLLQLSDIASVRSAFLGRLLKSFTRAFKVQRLKTVVPKIKFLNNALIIKTQNSLG